MLGDVCRTGLGAVTRVSIPESLTWPMAHLGAS